VWNRRLVPVSWTPRARARARAMTETIRDETMLPMMLYRTDPAKGWWVGGWIRLNH
jgi:hypothetical protein